MKLITPGEWRYALLLIPLLILAAVASVTTVSYVESLILELEYNRATQRLEDHLASEKGKLEDIARYAAVVHDLDGQDVDTYLDHVLREEAFQKMHFEAAALVDAEGNLLGLRLMAAGPAMDEEPLEEYLTCTNIVPFLPAEVTSWVGFARVATGPVLLALARVGGRGEEPSPDDPWLALVRPFEEDYVRRIQIMFPAFLGLATPETVKSPDAHAVPIYDLSHRQIGSFLFQFDLAIVEEAVSGVRLTIHAMTMGFLFMAGALGLWAIRSATEIEGIRRVGRFVDDMDYLRDGLLAVDKKHHVTGCNPSAREMAGKAPSSRDGVRDLFPMLTEADLDVLSDKARPREVEKATMVAHGKRTWRFRSQPTEDINLILVSDVTDEKAQEMRRRQVATLHMIGRVARGVAHDFNNILCAISGHAALLGIPETLTENDRISLQAIMQESERGAALAAHLLQLSRAREEEEPSDRLADHVDKAAGLLRVGLSSSWEVVTDLDEEFPVVPLSGIQIEQVVLNLGLVAADEMDDPGIVRVEAHPPLARRALFDVGEEFGAVIVVGALAANTEFDEAAVSVLARPTDEESGVIQSVVRTMLEEVGGRIDIMLSSAGRRCYRVCLPAFGGTKRSSVLHLPDEWMTYLAQWKVFVALPESQASRRLIGHLDALGTEVESATDIVGALSKVERDQAYTAMVFDKDILGAEAEADGLIRAIIKLQPKAGIVVLCKNEDTIPSSLTKDVIFETKGADLDSVIESMIRAKELVGQRNSSA